jgi:hypothetical protein
MGVSLHRGDMGHWGDITFRLELIVMCPTRNKIIKYIYEYKIVKIEVSIHFILNSFLKSVPIKRVS